MHLIRTNVYLMPAEVWLHWLDIFCATLDANSFESERGKRCQCQMSNIHQTLQSKTLSTK